MTNNLKRIFSWPSKSNNHLFPWWKVIWNVLWLPIIYIGRLIFVFGIAIQQGFNRALEAWDSTD